MEVVQSCLTLCDTRDFSPPGSSVHGDSPGKNTGVGCHFLLQGIFLSQGSNLGLLHYRQILYHLSHQGSPYTLLVVVSLPSHVRLFCNLMNCSLPGFSDHGISQARILEWVAISFSRGSFPTQGSNLCLLHWQASSLPLSHQ